MFRFPKQLYLLVMVTILILMVIQMRQELMCLVERNIQGVAVFNNTYDQFGYRSELGRSTCHDVTYLTVSGLLYDQNFAAALDHAQQALLQDSERGTLLPTYFVELLSARDSSNNQRWEDSLGFYRRAFTAMNTAGPGHERLSTTDLMLEYQEALVATLKAEEPQVSPDELIRAAIWHWRSGQRVEALAILRRSELLATGEYSKERISALQMLLEGEEAEKDQDTYQAESYYLKVPDSQPDMYARSLLRLARLTAGTSSYPYDNLLFDWEPSIPVEQSGTHVPFHVTGVEPLDGETIQDGGVVCFLLFGEGVVPSTFELAWRQHQRWVAEVCSPNLISDPSFSWDDTTDRLSSWYWPLYEGSGAPPEIRREETGERSGVVVCLNNELSHTAQRSGIAQQGPSVKPGELLLFLGRASTSDGGAVTLMGNWQNFLKVPTYFYASTLEDPDQAPWRWLGNIVVVPDEAPSNPTWGIQIYVVNYERPGLGCVDDLILVELGP
jgi:hypothetical protein